MKSLTSQFALSATVVAVLALSAAPSLNGAENRQTVHEQITAMPAFMEPVIWVGTQPPSESESQRLWEALKSLKKPGKADRLKEVEGFLTDYPDSAWIPSLKANLAVFHRSMGRYSAALHSWEEAWERVRSADDTNAKLVGDYVLAQWTSLLSSLGRLEQLDALIKETRGRRFARLEWEKMFASARQQTEVMRRNPGISYRCGTYALMQVIEAMGPIPRGMVDLQQEMSPETGFSLAQLHKFAAKNNIGLVPAERIKGKQLVVPSVVHWKQNHYAAIVRQKGDLYEVLDATFGDAKWLKADVINEEASRYFLIPDDRFSDHWAHVSDEEAARVFGKGLDSQPPSPPPPPCPEEGQDECDCPAGGGGTGGGPPGDGPPPRRPSAGCDGCGMPEWSVSEPYISLWIRDIPMAYQPSRGAEVLLRMFYHQHETRPLGSNIFNFGPQWNCNWLTYLDIQDAAEYDPSFANYTAKVYGSGGGQRIYKSSDTTPDYYSFTRFERILDGGGNVSALKVIYPKGGESKFGLLVEV